MFLMFAPFETWVEQGKTVVLLLPMVPGMILLRELMIHDMVFDTQLAMTAAINGVVYLVFGVMSFHLMIKSARRKGVVGGY